MTARTPVRPSLARMQAQCAAFNDRHAIGDTIRVWPGAINERAPIEVTIVAPGAYVLSGHTAVVQTEGKGCIALTHVMREGR